MGDIIWLAGREGKLEMRSGGRIWENDRKHAAGLTLMDSASASASMMSCRLPGRKTEIVLLSELILYLMLYRCWIHITRFLCVFIADVQTNTFKYFFLNNCRQHQVSSVMELTYYSVYSYHDGPLADTHIKYNALQTVLIHWAKYENCC